jgi:hypothetical protein
MAAVGAGSALSFRETLARHLQAIQDRDLLYCENELRQQSHLTLAFARRDGKWLMVLDQNTPLK